ncbi:gamma-glutamylcyclotransferase [Pseudoalteromonas sp. A25]|uniref:gamma-glutamylcyclotransferase family protein n=1 Tax=Pseudoalteromonas sp. A25 TaxID=116092 RepID=UPI001260FAF7|nr:gamma-glutamylcyclotransferase family protein [Pseudoalteromonas sp. A25]BBN83600.1 gamma-glutamylcyclotransferase [Pseudoalteromonas sp. A25]
MEALFSYGTLQQTQVQLDTFGRTLSGTKDTLLGYVLGEVTITDPKVIATSGKDVHPILVHTGLASDQIDGTVFLLTDDELTQADNYEVDEYVRVQAQLASGNRCWIYAASKK